MKNIRMAAALISMGCMNDKFAINGGYDTQKSSMFENPIYTPKRSSSIKRRKKKNKVK